MLRLWRAGVIPALFLGVFILGAQQESKRFRLLGEVASETGHLPHGLSVEVYDMAGHTPLDKVAVHQRGTFEVDHLTSNQLEVRLVSFEGEVICKEYVHLVNSYAPVIFRLPAVPGSKPIEGAVSAGRLNHSPPKKARRAFQQSQQAQAKGEIAKALELLQFAVREDPLYLEAWNNLGSYYMRAGDPDQALIALRRAQSLDGNNSHVLTNLGIVLLHKKQSEEAEEVARRALRQLRSDTKAEYVLGMSLFQGQKNPDEALFYLEKAKAEFPKARLNIAHILVRAGKIAQAREELEAYLAVSREREASVRKWLEALATPKGAAALAVREQPASH